MAIVFLLPACISPSCDIEVRLIGQVEGGGCGGESRAWVVSKSFRHSWLWHSVACEKIFTHCVPTCWVNCVHSVAFRKGANGFLLADSTEGERDPNTDHQWSEFAYATAKPSVSQIESRETSLSGSYVGPEIYERNKPNSSGSVSNVGMISSLAGVEDLDGVGVGDRWFKFDPFGRICGRGCSGI
jgi:hypothetical protein